MIEITRLYLFILLNISFSVSQSLYYCRPAFLAHEYFLEGSCLLRSIGHRYRFWVRQILTVLAFRGTQRTPEVPREIAEYLKFLTFVCADRLSLWVSAC